MMQLTHKSALALIASTLSLVDVSAGQVIYSVNNATDDISGIPILTGTRGDKPMLTWGEAIAQVSVFRNDSLEPLIKSGQLKNITFSQDDEDAIAQATPGGVYKFYSYMPLLDDFEKQMSVTPPILPNFEDIQCCKVPSTNHFTLPNIFGGKRSNTEEDLKHMARVHASRRNAQPSANVTDGKSNAIHVINKGLQVKNIPLIGLPLLPRVDYFYSQSPSSYSSLNLGDPISYRSLFVIGNYYGNSTRMYQVAYRSESTQGSPNQDTGTVVIPQGNDNIHFVSYQNHEDGNSVNCHESFQLAIGAKDADIALFTKSNWVTLVPDYEGPHAVFGANVRAGRSILNFMRAFLRIQSVFQVTNYKSFMFGYSSGSTTTAIAAEISSSYAPDLVPNMMGIAIGGFVANMTQATESVNRGRYAAFIPMQLSSLAKEYPEFKTYLDQHKRLNSTFYFTITQTCSFILEFFIGKDFDHLTDLGTNFIRGEPLRSILIENSAGNYIPPVPVYVFQSTADQSADVADVDRVVSYYCQGGARVAYIRDNNNLGHLDEEALRSGTAVPFFKDVIAGNLPNYCSNWQSAVVPGNTY